MTGEYKSPFSGRFASPQMRGVYSEDRFHAGLREMWYSLAKAQHAFRVVSDQELDDIGHYADPSHIDIERIREIDRDIRHDITAALRHYAEQARIGGGKLHLGGTSRDPQDNLDIMRAREASDILITRLVNTLYSWKPWIETYADKPTVSWTHYQPAGFITVGYRFANYAQGLLIGLRLLETAKDHFLKGKGFKGIDGSSAGYKFALEGKGTPEAMEEFVAKELGLEFFPVTTQIYPRVVDYITLTALASIAGVSSKFASDLRFLSSPLLGEVDKKPEEGKVGSSDAPWKVYNPTNAERINALAAYVLGLPQIAGTNVITDPFEGAVQDSANRRIILPEGFMATDHILMEYDYILQNLEVWDSVVERNVTTYGGFMGLREVIAKATEKGGNRQELHERLRRYSVDAWNEFKKTGNNPFPKYVMNDEMVGQYLSRDQLELILNPTLDPSRHTGTSSQKTIKFIEDELDPVLERYKERAGIHIHPEF